LPVGTAAFVYWICVLFAICWAVISATFGYQMTLPFTGAPCVAIGCPQLATRAAPAFSAAGELDGTL